jgi:Aerotolerance regulator N-terminal
MQFLNPLMLWGILAVGIPIALHFWHQKKGQLLNWAATQWLTEKDLQPSKGIRLDNILLLIIRCLLIMILAFLLAKPVFHWSKSDSDYTKIHLVQSNTLLINNYKFELEEALKKGEKIYQISNDAESMETISTPSTTAPLHPLTLQTCLNKVYELNRDKGNLKFELYVVNNQALSQVSAIFVPSVFTIHSIIDTLQIPPKPYLEFLDKRKLFLNESGQLTAAAALPLNEKFETQPAHSGSIHVLIDTENKPEKQLLNAALKALTDVYKIDFSIDEAINVEKHYDWVFSDRRLPDEPKAFSAKTLFISSDGNDISPNEELQTARISNEMLTNGQLAEWLGELLVRHFQLNPYLKPLSNQQLNALFKTLDAKLAINKTEESTTAKWIFLVFILLLGIERWLAIRKNA